MLSVVTPAAGTRLTSVLRVRDALQLAETEVAQPRLDGWIDDASSAIAGYCNRVFGREVLRQTFPQPASLGLSLRRRPTSLVSVAIDGQALEESRFERDAEDGALYRMDQTGRRVLWGGCVVVVFTTGWVLPDDAAFGTTPAAERLPGDVEAACHIVIEAIRAGAGRDPMLRSESEAGVGASSWIATAEMGALPPTAAGRLEAYRRIAIA